VAGRAPLHETRDANRLGRVRLLFAVGQTAEDLEDHSKIALGAEVRDIDAAELAA